MKAVLLAAGRSFRMQPIADKNFLKFLGKPLIVHQLESLLAASFSEILIVGGAHNMAQLKKVLRECSLPNRPSHSEAKPIMCPKGATLAKITVREQKDLDLGMAGAVLTAASWIKNDPFLVVSSNDVVDISTYNILTKSLKKGEGVLMAKKVSAYFPGGYLKTRPSGIVSSIIEKPGAGKEPSKLVNIVMHYHPEPKRLFTLLKQEAGSKNQHDDRYELALQSLFDAGVIYKAMPFEGFWQPVKYPWHVLSLMNYFLKAGKKFARKKVSISKTATLHGDVFLEEGVRILDNAVIVGPAYIGKNSIIATDALVRESHIGANCVIGFGSEVARSYVGDEVWTHTNYIGDSVIGNDVSFGAGTVTGNLRLDEKNILVTIRGEKADSGLNKFGLVTGNHVRVGINTSFMPGVKIGSHSFVGAGITVAEDIPDSMFVTGKHTLVMKPNKAQAAPRKTQ
ncbi:MAG: sugar phosphate nucleotidyltransferase [Patescibacteria group bacterium]|mgnify:CR=1 FL=1